MMSGAIDVCNFDASWGGGPTEWRRVAALRGLLRGSDGTSRGAARFPRICLASVANGTYMETFHPDRDPLFYALVANRSKFDNGYYAVPQGPVSGLNSTRA